MPDAQEQTITIRARTMERYEIIQQSLRNEIEIRTTAARLRISERQVYRLRKKVRGGNVTALVHGNSGKRSNNALGETLKKQIEILVKKKYADFGPTLAKEKLKELHHVEISKETLRQLMSGWNLWKPRSRKENTEHREWRERRALFGELQQFDGCYHAWFEERASACCLLAAIDDATGRITGLRFVDWEGVFASFEFWRAYIKRNGKPQSIYLDRHSTYKVNARALLDDPEARSQFGRACNELGIEIIHAYSPEAKGRVERLFKTLQDRLVKELRLENVSDRDAANEWVRTTFIPAFNAKFSVVPKETADAHQPQSENDRVAIDRIFSARTERVVMNDFTIVHKGVYYQLEKTNIRLVYKREKVEIEERPDGTRHIYLRGAYLPFHALPARPVKVRDASRAPKLLAHLCAPQKPAADHPWRKFRFGRERKIELLEITK